LKNIERIDMNTFTKPGTAGKALFIAGMGAFFTLAQGSPVAPPPLPTGSTMVQTQAGMSPDEVKRGQRAHHHDKHHKKNYMRDDTLDDAARNQGEGDENSRSDRPSSTQKNR
jgi:hypothetical protein